MNEGFPKKIAESAKETSAYVLAGKPVEKIIHNEGLRAGVQKFLEATNIQPIYEAENNPEVFAEMRNKLNTEAGLIIANHPGYFDNAVILNTLEREDIKIVASSEGYRKLGSIVGKEKLIEVTKNIRDVDNLLDTIKIQIEGGGVVLLYPTAGSDRVDIPNKSFEFRSGLSHMLKTCLKPENMVYSFDINPDDVQQALNEITTRYIGASVAFRTKNMIQPNKDRQTLPIRLKERYSKAEEWQSVIGEGNKIEKNKRLVDHFLAQFEK